MAEQLSLHAQIAVSLGGQDTHVDIIATSAEELLHTVAFLTGQQSTQPAPQPAPTPAVAQQTQAQPQPTPTAQPGPSAAEPAPAAAATPSATETAAQPSQPSVALNDVLASARQLLQQPKGEDDLRKILGRVGAESISQSNPDHFEWIKYAIDQVNAGQSVDAVIA